MSILCLRAIRVIGALCTATLTLACTTPTTFAPVATTEHPTLNALPAIELGQGRIILYRKANAEGPSHALTMIDAGNTFDIRAGRFAHLDVAPGQHMVEVVLAKMDYTKLVTEKVGHQLEKRVRSHRLYGKPLRVDIRAGETAYVEVATAGVGISAGGSGRAASGVASAAGSRSGSGTHFVTLTPSYHSATQVRGLRYRVLFPTLVATDAELAQSDLRLATRCGPECVVPPKIAELATRARRRSPVATSTPATSPLASDRSTPEPAAGAQGTVDVPAARYFH